MNRENALRQTMRDTASEYENALANPDLGKSLDILNRGTIGGTIGGFADVANMLLNATVPGYNVDKPFMGTEWIGDRMQDMGMVSDKRYPVEELLASLFDPMSGAAKIPAMMGIFANKKASLDDLLAKLKPSDMAVEIPAGANTQLYEDLLSKALSQEVPTDKSKHFQYLKRSLELGRDKPKHSVSVQFSPEHDIIGAASMYPIYDSLRINTMGGLGEGGGTGTLASASEAVQQGGEGRGAHRVPTYGA
jgi:hypothetical protein